MTKPQDNKDKTEKKEIDFDKIMKSLLSVPPKENVEIKEKARKERKKENRKNNKG